MGLAQGGNGAWSLSFFDSVDGEDAEAAGDRGGRGGIPAGLGDLTMALGASDDPSTWSGDPPGGCCCWLSCWWSIDVNLGDGADVA